MTLSDKRNDFLWMIVEMLNWVRPVLEQNNTTIYVNYWNRTVEEQERLVAEGLSSTMKSKHLDKLAVDFILIRGGKFIQKGPIYDMMGRWWQDHGGRWGGEWKRPYDPYHFEYNVKRRNAWRQTLSNPEPTLMEGETEPEQLHLF